MTDEAGHDWEASSLSSEETLTFTTPQGSACVQIHFEVDSSIWSLRHCRKCGAESVNGEVTKEGCDQIIVRTVMST